MDLRNSDTSYGDNDVDNHDDVFNEWRNALSQVKKDYEEEKQKIELEELRKEDENKYLAEVKKNRSEEEYIKALRIVSKDRKERQKAEKERKRQEEEEIEKLLEMYKELAIKEEDEAQRSKAEQLKLSEDRKTLHNEARLTQNALRERHHAEIAEEEASLLEDSLNDEAYSVMIGKTKVHKVGNNMFTIDPKTQEVSEHLLTEHDVNPFQDAKQFWLQVIVPKIELRKIKASIKQSNQIYKFLMGMEPSEFEKQFYIPKPDEPNTPMFNVEAFIEMFFDENGKFIKESVQK